MVADSARFQVLYSQLADWLEGHGIAVAGVWAEHFNVGWLLRMVQGVTARLNTTISFWIVVVVYVLLGLLDTEAIARNIRRALSVETANAVIGGGALTASKLRRYMLVRTVMSLATGLLVWALRCFRASVCCRVGRHRLYPQLYPLHGAVRGDVLAKRSSPGAVRIVGGGILIFAGLNIIQFVIGSYIEPRVAGYALAMSPFLVLFSVFFWSFVWGLFGAFIGVPITIMILTFCAQHSSTRWIAEILGAPTARKA